MPRHKAYEPDEVLNDAMQLFWTEGFEVTSIPKLEKHLGINRFSIYDTFGSKRDLFVRALECYASMLVDTLVEPLETGSAGLKDLERFFAKFQKLFLNQEVPRGCLICNTATELGNRDKEVATCVESYFNRVETAVFNCLMRAHDLGELQGSRSLFQNRARLARSMMQGILMDLRLGRSSRDIRRTLNALKTLLCS